MKGFLGRPYVDQYSEYIDPQESYCFKVRGLGGAIAMEDNNSGEARSLGAEAGRFNVVDWAGRLRIESVNTRMIGKLNSKRAESFTLDTKTILAKHA